MERLVYLDESTWKHTGTVQQHIAVLEAAAGLHQDSLGRVGYLQWHNHDQLAIRACWESGLFNLTQLSHITGITRVSLRKWLPQDGEARPRGSLNPEHLAPMATVLRHAAQTHENQVSTEFLQNLVREGTKATMSRILLGLNENREVAISYVSDDVQPRVRPDDQGHPGQGEGGGADQHPDQAGDGSGDGQDQPEPDHAGELQGTAERTPAAQPRPAAKQRVRSEHRRVVPAKRSEDFGPPVVGDDWHPLEDFHPDKDGDELLVRGKHTIKRGLMDGVPVGQRWEQASPESGH